MKHLLCSLLLLLPALIPAHAATGADASALTVQPIPEAVFTDQNGQPRQLRADLLHNRVVAINFIFTSCASICPPMGAAFASLQHLTAARGLDVRFLSISIDPVTDTPPRLAAWAAQFQGTSAWTLLTGPQSAVDAVQAALGLKSPTASMHSPVVVMGNTTDGRWQRANALAPPEALLSVLEQLSRPR